MARHPLTALTRDVKYLAVIFLACAVHTSFAADEILTSGADLGVDVSRADGRIAMSLAGNIWTVPATGGQATLIVDEEAPLRRPRWSPTDSRFIYQADSPAGSAIWITEPSETGPVRVSQAGVHDQDASWHPDGERIVYVSDRHDSGLDIWETDLPTGLAWRLTDMPGDESEPVWSANGRHLAWISKAGDVYALMLRRYGEPTVTLLESDTRLSAPSWRPDGSLLTYLRHGDDGLGLEMAILSEPVLVRAVDSDDNFMGDPVAWLDRLNMIYAADGLIRTRGFEDRRSRPLHFRASVAFAEPPAPKPVVRREIEIIDPPEGRLIIRGARLFDGLWHGYRQDMDVVIRAGRVSAIEPRRDRNDGTVLDLGDVTVMPGLVDAWSATDDSPAAGAKLLAYGVTTVVGSTAISFDPAIWEGEETPGPRFLQIEDPAHSSIALSIADSRIENISLLLGSRQAVAFGHTKPPARRFATLPELGSVATTVVAGSKPNRMPPGLALHAELLALQEAGLSAEQALHAVGRNPAKALGLEFQVGTLMPGSLADMVLVRGDPLTSVTDSLKIVAVVRNGRFFSLLSLLERAATSANVE